MHLCDMLRPTHSIVLRTALLFALLTASVITVMGLVVRTAVDDHFADMDRSQMAGKLELLQQALAGMRSPDDTPRIQQELDRALELAQKIAEQAPLAVQAVIENARTAVDYGWLAAYSKIADMQQRLYNSDDAKEGVLSFQEKRPAKFMGR